MPKPALILGIVALLAAAGGAAAWYFWPEEPEPESLEDKDTGLTRDQTEEMMRTIGYVQ